MPDGEDRAAERVWRALPPGTRDALETGLPGTDLQTLLLAVARARAGRRTTADVMRQWRRDRFVRPAASDPRLVAAVEARLWRLLPAEFAGIELSPVTPLGTCSAVSPVSQNRVVSTARSSEVVSDSTNVLAIEAAARRRGQPRHGRVDLAACHRQLRAQAFGPGAAAHFRLFALVSSARDTGSGRTEASMLTRHLAFWMDVLDDLIPHRQPRIELSVFDEPVIAERLADTIRPALAGRRPTRSGNHTAVNDRATVLTDDPERTRGRGYYTGLALRIAAGDDTELGDGGLCTWTARLAQDAKERCLISCIATERLAALAGSAGPGRA